MTLHSVSVMNIFRNRLTFQCIFTYIVFSTVLCFILSCNDNKRRTDYSTISALDSVEFYKEQYRPQFHFSPKEKWMNDPNGLVYYNGKYHLFYQFYPEDIVWGPMHWGHAVSMDLYNWKHLPIALYPDENGYIFSGSAVMDMENTSGFGSKDKPAMVAVFTYHNMEGEKAGRNDYQTQGIAYSLDEGITWIKYKGNPVISNQGVKDFRDPKVFWHTASKKWIMSLVAGDRAQFYSSSNLKDWEFLSEFGENTGAHGGVWECPDLFPLKVEGTDEIKWVLIISINPGAPNGGSGTQYFVGDFDGSKFTTDQKEDKWIDLGRDNYAGVTYNNAPDNERIFIGWMSNWDYARDTPTKRWRSAMTLPRKLSLEKDSNGYFLKNYPVDGFESLRSDSQKENHEIMEVKTFTHTNFNRSEISFTTASKDLELVFSNTEGDKVILSQNKGVFSFDRTRSGLVNFKDNFADGISQMDTKYLPDPKYEWRIILDKSSVEVFLNQGQYVMTNQVFPRADYTTMKIKNLLDKGSIELSNFQINTINSIW